MSKDVHEINPAVALPPTSNNGFDVDSNNYSSAAMAVAGGATEQEDNNGTANTRESLPTTSKNAPNGGM